MEPVVSHDTIVELLGAYALDAVDPDEAELVAQHLAVCPRCATEVDEHRGAASLLANQGGDAPSGLWDRISAQIQGAGDAPPSTAGIGDRLPTGVGAGDVPWAVAEQDRSGSWNGPVGPVGAGDRTEAAVPAAGPPAEPAGPVHFRPAPAPASSAARRRPWVRAAMPVLAAAAAVVIALLAVQVGRLDGRVGSLSALATRQGMPALAEAALADPRAQRVALVSSGSSPRTVGDLVILPTGAAFLVEGSLPALPGGRTYQLWGITGGQAVSLGLLGRNPQVVAFNLGVASPVSSFAVTAEPAGGVVVSTGPPVAKASLRSV